MKTDPIADAAIKRLMKATKVDRKRAEKETEFLYFRILSKLSDIKNNAFGDERQMVAAAILHSELQKRADSIANRIKPSVYR